MAAEASEADFQLVLRRLGADDVTLVLPNGGEGLSVADIKELAEKKTGIDRGRQKLLFMGKIMNNTDCLVQHSHLVSGGVVHLLETKAPPSPQRSGNSDDAQNAGVSLETPAAGTGSAQLAELLERPELLQQLLLGLSHGAGPVSANRLQEAPGVHPYTAFRSRDVTGGWQRSLEPVNQGLMSIDSVVSTLGGWFSLSGASPSANTPACLWYEGQWLDVCDTADTWLESTVLRVSHDGRSVLIHYHGWSERWDEWISVHSTRLAPFRTRTVHNLPTRLTPVPMIIPGAAPVPPPSSNHVSNVLPAVTSALRGLLNGLDAVNSRVQRLRWDSPNPVLPPAGGADLSDLEGAPEAVDGSVRITLHGHTVRGAGASSGHPAAALPPSRQASIQAPAASALFPPQPLDQEHPHLQAQEVASMLVALGPLADRVGRVVADLGPHLSHLGRDLAIVRSISQSVRQREVPEATPYERQVAGVMAARGVHMSADGQAIGVAPLPSHRSNSVTSAPGAPTVTHENTETTWEYYGQVPLLADVANGQPVPETAVAAAAAAGASSHRRLAAGMAALPPFPMAQGQSAARTPASSWSWALQPTRIGGMTLPQSLPWPAGALTGMLQLRHTVHPAPAAGTRSDVHMSVPAALAAGTLNMIRSPRPALGDVGGDEDERLILRRSLLGLQAGMQQLRGEAQALRQAAEAAIAAGPSAPRAPERGVPSPPSRPAPPSQRSPPHRASAPAAAAAAAAAGRVGTELFPNPVETDVGPPPQQRVRQRRESLLAARVRAAEAAAAALQSGPEPRDPSTGGE